MAIRLPPARSADGLAFTDVDDEGANDWTASRDSEWLRWDAVAGNGLDWAMTFSFSFESDEPNLPARVNLEPVEPGDFGDPSFRILYTLFADGFEAGNDEAWDASIE